MRPVYTFSAMRDRKRRSHPADDDNCKIVISRSNFFGVQSGIVRI